jgi:hypothetical protein
MCGTRCVRTRIEVLHDYGECWILWCDRRGELHGLRQRSGLRSCRIRCRCSMYCLQHLPGDRRDWLCSSRSLADEGLQESRELRQFITINPQKYEGPGNHPGLSRCFASWSLIDRSPSALGGVQEAPRQGWA